MGMETAMIQIQDGYFFTISLELITYEGKDKKTVKGKLGGCEQTFTGAKIQLDNARKHLEQELCK